MGGLFALAAWLLTRGTTPLPIDVGPLAPVLAYLVAVVGWGLGVVPPSLIIVAKLAVFVAVPMLLFRTRLTLRFSRRDLAITLVFALALCALQVVAGSGMKRIAAAGLHGLPLALAAAG